MASGSARTPSSVLLAALQKDNRDLDEHPVEFLQAAAQMLAEEVERLAPIGGAAKRIRSLAFNLANNHRLRRDLLSGKITCQALCAMDPSQWASESVKRARESAVARSEVKLRMARTGGEEFSLARVICPECDGRRARFKHLGTDMKDWHGRKNEVWGTKHDDDEGLDCEITCTTCDHSWRGAAPEVLVEEDAEADDLEESRRKDLVLQPERESVHKRA